MIFARSFGFSPSIQTFIAGAEWNRFSFPFEKFGTDGHDIWGIFYRWPNPKGEICFIYR